MYYETQELTNDQAAKFVNLADKAVGTDMEINPLDDFHSYVLVSDLETMDEVQKLRDIENSL